MPTITFYPLDATYTIINNKPIVKLYGRTIDGKRIMITDDAFLPYFYVLPKQQKAEEQLLKLRIEEDTKQFSVLKVETIKKILNGKELSLLKVTVNVPPAVPKLREIVKQWESVDSIYEYDILFTRRYFIDKGLTPMTLCKVEGEIVEEDGGLTVKAASIETADDHTFRQPKIVAVDIETYSPFNKAIDFHKYPIVMIALYSTNFKKVIVSKQLDGEDVEVVQDEQTMLARFKEVVKELQPDILTGYFSDGFDLPYIRARADKYRMKMDLGPRGEEMRLKTGNDNAVQITGLVHLDIFKFIKKVMRGSLETEAFGLNAVASELLGEEKQEVDLSTLPEAWDSNNKSELEKFAQYNIHDARLAYELSTKMLPTIIELVKMVGLPIYDINRMGYSQLVEWYVLKLCPQYNQIAPNKPKNEELVERKQRHIEGAFVFEPKPGLYKDIVVYDYLSLYPTIISSHNLDPGTLVDSSSEEPAEEVPGQPFRFSTQKKGFLPTVIEGIIQRRTQTKKEMKDASKEDLPFLDAQQGALKLMANSFYGYLGFYGARWYSKESAAATTAWGRYHIQTAIKMAEQKGFDVLYSDTDSLFLSLSSKKKEESKQFAFEVNKTLPGLMELEFEGYYPTGIFVSSKMSGSGAKKKYALLKEDGGLTIKGFETVRRNWSAIAKETQEKVLAIVLREQDVSKAVSYTKKIIKDLRDKKIEKDKVIIRMQLVKDLLDYAAKGPHVAVAQRLKNRGEDVRPGTIIEYIITKGTDILRNRAKLPEEINEGEYDPEYYVTHQIIPSVDRIFDVLGVHKDEILLNSKQQSLSGFFS